MTIYYCVLYFHLWVGITLRDFFSPFPLSHTITVCILESSFTFIRVHCQAGRSLCSIVSIAYLDVDFHGGRFFKLLVSYTITIILECLMLCTACFQLEGKTGSLWVCIGSSESQIGLWRMYSALSILQSQRRTQRIQILAQPSGARSRPLP